MLRAVRGASQLAHPYTLRRAQELGAVHFDMEQYAYKDLYLYPEAVVDGR